MAPITTKSRSKSSKPTSSFTHTPTSDTTFSTSKRDKRTIKSSIFASKVAKSAAPASKKRRRPSKKLITTLDSLSDALPTSSSFTEPSTADSENGNKIKHKSLKSRPGAMKRKEKLEMVERERFGKNLAQMASVHSATEAAGGTPAVGAAAMPAAAAPTTSRWAALRGFISQTMEQKEEFRK